MAKKARYKDLEEALYQSRQLMASKIFLDWEQRRQNVTYQSVPIFQQEASEEQETVFKTTNSSNQQLNPHSKNIANKPFPVTKDQETQTSDGNEISMHQLFNGQDISQEATGNEDFDLLTENSSNDRLKNVEQAQQPSSPSITIPKFKFGSREFSEMLTSKIISYILIETADVSLTLSKIADTVTEMDVKVKEIGYWRQLKIFLSDFKNRACLSGNEMMPLLVLHHKNNTPGKATTVRRMIRIFGTLKAPINTKIVIVLNEDRIMLDGYQKSCFSNPDQVGVLGDTFTWNDLTNQFQKMLLQRQILDQAKPRSLNEFCNSFVHEKKELLLQSLVKDKLLIDLIHYKQFPVIFRQTIPPVNLYIERKLKSRYVISTSIFNIIAQNEIFVFSGFKSIDDFEEISRGCSGKIDVSGNQLCEDNITATFILLERKNDMEKLCDKIANQKIIHWLHYDQLNLIWKQTVGDNIEALEKFVCNQNQREIPEEEFLKMIETRNAKEPIIISDSPGMGKSFLLTKLAEETRQLYQGNSLVFYFLMTDFVASVLNQQMQQGIKPFLFIFKHKNSVFLFL